MENIIICSNCKGKGHTMDGATALSAALSIVMLPLLLFERNDKDGITRQPCCLCKGKGFIKIKE